MENKRPEPERKIRRDGAAAEFIRAALCALIVAAALVLSYASTATAPEGVDVAASVNGALTGDGIREALSDIGRNITDAEAWARFLGFEQNCDAVAVNGG